ncbi:olfactory receptor 6B1-like [Spea bombifrons]|uniref:olfactory receptor 6B1-like n=1 Tax=Spea bombifrons TaxID=233779 RepID=UPI00234BA842|nr:olfactory receptor 6B1-like [Spea bombifrons]
MANRSDVTEFVFVGFPGLPQKLYHLVSVTIFLVYNMALFANGIVIVLIILKEHLHQPMYVIIGNLALSDLLLDTMTLPKVVAKYWFGDDSIPFSVCFFQMFFVHSLGSLDSFIIMLMAIDRYVAICKPLRYFSIISNPLTVNICCVFWFLASVIGLAIAILGAQLPYCGPNRIKSYFCSLTPVTLLSCANSASTRRITFIIAMFVHLVPLSFIIFSYVMIIKTIRSSAHAGNWQKAFSTCTTHSFVIGMYYVPRLLVYTYNQIQVIPNADLNVLLICLYTFVPHVASPIVYCLRTEEIKTTLANAFKKIRSSRKINRKSEP